MNCGTSYYLAGAYHYCERDMGHKGKHQCRCKLEWEGVRR